jgi:hypothetical protein
MRYALLFTLAALSALTSTAALAGEGLDNARWCETQTGPPAQAEAMAARMPDGNLRGTRSAATLIAEAKSSARAGKDDEGLLGLGRANGTTSTHSKR